MTNYGPQLELSERLHREKYRSPNESFEEAMTRIASALKEDDKHFRALRDILLDQRFLPGGRIQLAIGSSRQSTPYNCFVSRRIDDSIQGIMEAASDAMETMRRGGGIGYDFSSIRPRGSLIQSLDSQASGPISFMNIFDACCATVASAGNRRGAQMGVLRIDHPDIEEFIRAKRNTSSLTRFNISVGVTDEFMHALEADTTFDLVWDSRTIKTVRAKHLWEEIMRGTWDWAEPGILFIDTINRMNNLWYCEDIAATNPCGEQPLPPYGACLLGSFNLTKYVRREMFCYSFDYNQLREDIAVVVPALDNVIDQAIYPLPGQEKEAKNKRRMGIGVTGAANALEVVYGPYGSPAFLRGLKAILKLIANEAYRASVGLAIKKGAFPLYDYRYPHGHFINSGILDRDVLTLIKDHGIRNSHLTSIAPTGTISLTADNVSSGIEPVFSLSSKRIIQTDDGPKEFLLEDYGKRVFGNEGKTADACSAKEHLRTLLVASSCVDSAVSKTCNVGPNVQWDEFKDIYVNAWKGGAKGCTTFRAEGKRMGILKAESKGDSKYDEQQHREHHESAGPACFIDSNGQRHCGD